MSAIIFAGPTIAAPDIRHLCDATVLPPAAMGDVFRAARLRPRAIGIIDGYFEGAPSVWHKEILWTMAEGIAVFGAASMGALRAAELAAFGMRGIGDIFADYRAGRLEDDDEVAVEHGPAEMGYITMSEPMVNIRATLARGVSEGIVSAAAADGLIGLAKGQFYKARSWQGLLRENAALAPAERDALARWLPANAIDVKRNDALKMVAAMAEFLAARHKTAKGDFALEWTVMWDKATRAFIPHGAIASSIAEALSPDLVLDELRLDPQHYAGVRRRALARKLIDTGSQKDHSPADPAALRREMFRFRARKGLLTHGALLHWLSENGLDGAAFERLLEEELRLDGAAASGRGLDIYVIAELQLTGAYSTLARRARHKQELVGDVHGHRLSVMQARLRYFEDVLGRPVPDDIAEYAEDAGFADASALDRAIMREIAYRRQIDQAAASGT